MFCGPEAAMVLTARGPEQQAKGTDTVGAWINLCLATGRAGRPFSGYGCLTGQGNGQPVQHLKVACGNRPRINRLAAQQHPPSPDWSASRSSAALGHRQHHIRPAARSSDSTHIAHGQESSDRIRSSTWARGRETPG